MQHINKVKRHGNHGEGWGKFFVLVGMSILATCALAKLAAQGAQVVGNMISNSAASNAAGASVGATSSKFTLELR